MSKSQYHNNPNRVFDFAIDYKDPKLLQEGMAYVVREIVDGWSSLPDESISFTVISGGITNLLYHVIAKDPPPTSPPGVLLRIYGLNTEVIIDRERENALFAQLSRLGFAPDYLGRFTNGRVEGFLEATRPLIPEEMGQVSPVDYCGMIGRELARMHTMKVECDTMNMLWFFIDKCANLAAEIRFDDDPAKQALLSTIDLASLRDEVRWLRHELETESYGTTTASQVVKDQVFSHQDLLCGNILTSPGWDRVQLIDFEYGGYNYRGFDMANHFCEHAGYEPVYTESYPDKAKQLHFLKAYFDALAIPQIQSEGDAFLEDFYVVVNRYACASHLFWGHWAIIQARYSPIDFDFLSYAKLRLDGYTYHKKLFFPPSPSA